MCYWGHGGGGDPGPRIVFHRRSPEIVVRGPTSVGDAIVPLDGGEMINFGTVGGDGISQDLRFTSDGSTATYTATVEIRSDDPNDPSLEFTLTAESSATTP